MDHNHNFTIAQFLEKESTSNKDFSLTSLLNNIPEKNESYLRENLAKKVEKGTLYSPCSYHGTISTFDLGFRYQKDDKTLQSICYFNLYRQLKHPFHEFIVCLTLEDSIQNLDFFQSELDAYFRNYLEQHLSNLDNFVSTELESSLNNWYQLSIEYLGKNFEMLNVKEIAILIENSFSCNEIEIKKICFDYLNLEHNLNYMLKALDCSYLLTAKNDRSKLSELKLVIAKGDQNQITFSNNGTLLHKKLYFFIQKFIKYKSIFVLKESSEFSLKLSKAIFDSYADNKNLFLCKQLIENAKITVKFTWKILLIF